jgi:hypothetical protein
MEIAIYFLVFDSKQLHQITVVVRQQLTCG